MLTHRRRTQHRCSVLRGRCECPPRLRAVVAMQITLHAILTHKGDLRGAGKDRGLSTSPGVCRCFILGARSLGFSARGHLHLPAFPDRSQSPLGVLQPARQVVLQTPRCTIKPLALGCYQRPAPTRPDIP